MCMRLFDSMQDPVKDGEKQITADYAKLYDDMAAAFRFLEDHA